MRKERILLILTAAVCVALALLLAAGAVGIYAEGSARRAEDPLANIYTAENVAEKLKSLAPVIILATVLFVVGIVLGVRDPNAENPAKGSGLIKPKDDPKHKPFIQTALVILAAAFILLGALNGSAHDVLVKAINICTECIGLG